MALTPFRLPPEWQAFPSNSTLKNTKPIWAKISSSLVPSHTTTPSAFWPLIIACMEPFPPPSSSHTEVITTSPGSVSRPASFNSWTAMTEAIRPPFMSAVPRPYIFPSLISGLKGWLVHSSVSSAGITSMWLLNIRLLPAPFPLNAAYTL